jgi:hypothetical protein
MVVPTLILLVVVSVVVVVVAVSSLRRPSMENEIYLNQDVVRNKTSKRISTSTEKKDFRGKHDTKGIPPTTSTKIIDQQEQQKSQIIVLYSHARPDRAGAALLDRLLCHAYAFQEGAVYGGACDSSGRNNIVVNGQAQDQLVEFWGLSHVLPWACPPPPVPQQQQTDHHQDHRPTGDDEDNRVIHILVPREAYFEHDTTIFTLEWQRYIHMQMIVNKNELSLQSLPSAIPQSTTTSSSGTDDATNRMMATTRQVAVHVRRGDVTPCTTPERYLSNAYYLAVLDEYLDTPGETTNIKYQWNVTIYSETKSYESWQPFVDRGYHLALDYDLVTTWQAFVTADILVLSKSSFSLVPALLRSIIASKNSSGSSPGNDNDNHDGMVIYTPFWHQPLSGWTIVRQDLVQRYNINNGEGHQCP